MTLLALTTDIWTSAATEAYITVTGHFGSLVELCFVHVGETGGMQWPICTVLSDDTVIMSDDKYLELRTKQWDIAKELVAVVKPFEVAMTFFSHEENTISVILPVVCSLVEGLKENSEDSANLKHFKSTIKADLTWRWSLDRAVYHFGCST